MESNLQEEEYAGEARHNRAKRRKLSHEVGFRYGYRGEVVSGPLKMRILSCNGGHHQDGGSQSRAYGQENILRNDKSVYCTNKSRCNIVLSHPGDSAFTVTKIIIKAPPRGFTSPIQEGMVFISMSSKDLEARTSQYHIREESLDSAAYVPNAQSQLDSDDERALDIIAQGNDTDERPPSRRAETTLTIPARPPTMADLILAQASGNTARSRRVMNGHRIRRLPQQQYPGWLPQEQTTEPVGWPPRQEPIQRDVQQQPTPPAEENLDLARAGYETSEPYHSPRRHRRYQPNGLPRDGRSTPGTSIRDPMRSRPYHRRVAASTTSHSSQTGQSQNSAHPPSLPTQDNFNITIDCSDSSDDDEEISSPDILADLYRRDHRYYIDHSSELDLASDDGDDDTVATVRALRDHNARLGAMQGVGRRELPSRVEVMSLDELATDLSEEELGGIGSRARLERWSVAKEKGVLAPHARFFIEKEKSSVSIAFEPEVSGRYILLKLWGTTKGQNIDIQSVIVKGFAGPRFFPTAQFL